MKLIVIGYPKIIKILFVSSHTQSTELHLSVFFLVIDTTFMVFYRKNNQKMQMSQGICIFYLFLDTFAKIFL